MAPDLQASTFAAATAVKPLSSHTYEADFKDDWSIGSVPHGGFVTAVFLRVASLHFNTTLTRQNQPHTIALHLDFLRRTQVGPAIFTVKDTKLGRQTSVIHVTLTQAAEREEVVGYISNANIASESGVSYITDWSLSPAPVPVKLDRLGRGEDGNWGQKKAMPFESFRKATRKTEYYFPRQGQLNKNSADQWMRLSTGEKWTNASIGYVCDAFCLPAEAYTHALNPYDLHTNISDEELMVGSRKFWYPTLLLNLDIKKALPEEGVEWLFTRTSTKEIKNGRMDIEVIVMDENMNLVALSHHVSLAVDASRNVSQRRITTTGESKM